MKWIRTKVSIETHQGKDVHFLRGIRDDGQLYVCWDNNPDSLRKVLEGLLEMVSSKPPCPVDSCKGDLGWVEE